MQKKYGTIYVREYIQVAHRLTELPGKCQQIHGHSMLVTLYFDADMTSGYACGEDNEVLDFTAVKGLFREYLKKRLDHHLLLSETDPLLVKYGKDAYPGVVLTPGDPTVEKIAMMINDFFYSGGFPIDRVEVRETETNGVVF